MGIATSELSRRIGVVAEASDILLLAAREFERAGEPRLSDEFHRLHADLNAAVIKLQRQLYRAVRTLDRKPPKKETKSRRAK